jgi:ketosteroid isomerase-like protein
MFMVCSRCPSHTTRGDSKVIALEEKGEDMKTNKWKFIVLPFAILALFIGGGFMQNVIAQDVDSSFQEFLPKFEEGTSGFINGDLTLWLENASRSDDATIMGGWGAYEKRWDEVGPRYDWAAARFLESGAKVEVEYLASYVSGDLAYTVAIERSEALIVGQDKPAPLELRVTHIFRKENGVWKLLHRHADPLMEKTAPAAVLQSEN